MNNKKNKFNILHTDSFKNFGGAQNDIVILLKFMKLYYSEKFNIYVIHNNNERLKNELDKSGIINFSVKMTNFMDIFALLKIRRFLKQYDIDLINFHSSLDHFLGGIAAVSIFKKKIIKVLTRHVAYKVDFLKGFVIYRFLTDAFIVISDFIKKRLINDIRIDESLIRTIYSPRIQTDENKTSSIYESEKAEIREGFGIKPDEKMISLIGRLSGEKGHEVFIKAAELIIKKRQDLKFVIIGEGELRDYIIDLINKKGLKDYFVISGFKENIKKFIYASDLIAVPSGLEGMGSIIIESCALKKAVIASDAGGIPEIIKNNETGLLFKNGDFIELAEKIMYLIDKYDLIENFAINCYNEVVKKFDAKAVTFQTYEFYLEIINRVNKINK
ncbi:MAG: glycosyltransferase family 4 protein [Candidatus Acidulodesulfobacterium sp.]